MGFLYVFVDLLDLLIFQLLLHDKWVAEKPMILMGSFNWGKLTYRCGKSAICRSKFFLGNPLGFPHVFGILTGCSSTQRDDD